MKSPEQDRIGEGEFFGPSEYKARATADLVFCNGVFHHIPPADRATAVEYLYRCLRPGGLLALWENNPWNPGDSLRREAYSVRSRCGYSKPSAIAAHGKSGGFEVLQMDFLFVFPHYLRWLRGLEPHLARMPLGGQYQLLCHKPRETTKRKLDRLLRDGADVGGLAADGNLQQVDHCKGSQQEGIILRSQTSQPETIHGPAADGGMIEPKIPGCTNNGIQRRVSQRLRIAVGDSTR